MDTLYMVAVEHEPENCPLKQDGPEAAETLADKLERERPRGVFGPPVHHGAVLVRTADPASLPAAFDRVLPNHKPALVAVVPDGADVAQYYDRPELLDGDEGAAARLAVLDVAAELFPSIDFAVSRREGLPTKSLRQMPEYLRDNAPGRTHLAA